MVSNYLNQRWLVCWRIYAPFGLNGLPFETSLTGLGKQILPIFDWQNQDALSILYILPYQMLIDCFIQLWLYSYIDRTRHYNDVMLNTMASQITSLTTVYSAVYSGADQREWQSSASLAFARGIHRWPVNSPYKGPVTRKLIPFYDVIMKWLVWR